MKAREFTDTEVEMIYHALIGFEDTSSKENSGYTKDDIETIYKLLMEFSNEYKSCFNERKGNNEE